MPSDIVKRPKSSRGFSIIERAIDRLDSDVGIGAPRAETPRPRAAFVPPDKSPSALAPPADAFRPEAPPSVKPAADAPAAPLTLPVDRLRARGMITPGDERGRLSEQYRLIKRPLITRALGLSTGARPSPKLIMITSALPREGKTFTAFNLALSISRERAIQVVLVDADPHRGQILDTLGLQPRPGLMEYLAGEVRHLSEVLLPTERDNLWILPPGSPHNHGSELVAGPRMAMLAAELEIAHRPRLVLFDTPPLLASTESAMLASHVGQIVMVVEAAKTNRKTLEEALAMVSACPEVNLLLNKADSSFHYERYGEYKAA